MRQPGEDARIRRVRGALERLPPEARQAVRGTVELLSSVCAEAYDQPAVSGRGRERLLMG